MGDTSANALEGSVEAAAAATVVVGPTAAAQEQELILGRDEHNGGERASSASNNSAEEVSKRGEHALDEGGGGGDCNVNYGGNRWPRQETLALLKIRSDMDATFRDSSLKGPLWEEISRKLAELGYKRRAKKCKEKFENVYKYHKRTKDGRRASAGKSDGKTYRFFDQLEAFHHQDHHPPPHPPPPKPQPNIISTTTPPTPWSTNPPISTTANNTTLLSNNIIFATPNPTNATTVIPPTTKNNIQEANVPDFPPPQNHHRNHSRQPALVFSSPASSSSTASDEEFHARHKRKRKRKWKDFFRRLTRHVVRKQEEMQKRFLETVAKCESQRVAREEEWRAQDMSRISREHEMLVQERSAAAAKDASVIDFLQKVSGGCGSDQDHRSTNISITTTIPSNVDQLFSILTTNVNNANPVPLPPSMPPPACSSTTFATNATVVVSASMPPIQASRPGNLVNSSSIASSSRWPKTEVEALINLRTTLELKYHENGPKGLLWEEISAGMRQLGFDRSSKRCKEKWENINKYFKKVKENNKKRSEDSKTCPYFHKLDELYREKTKNSNIDHQHQHHSGAKGGSGKAALLRFGMEPLKVQPEKQWPLHQVNNLDIPMNSEEEEEEEEELEADEDRDSSTELEEHHHHYEGTVSGESYGIVANKHSSMDMVE